MSNLIQARMISAEDIYNSGCIDSEAIMNCIGKALVDFKNGSIILPDKISQIFDEKTQNRINCMPATIKTLGKNGICGVKWVSVFPNNPKIYSVPNVTGTIILSELEKGTPFAIIDGTLITSLRTAFMGALAAKYLANPNSEIIGIIGAGEQARMHFVALKSLYPQIKKCLVASRSEGSENSFINQVSDIFGDVEFIKCKGDYRAATKDADIIVTAVSCQEPLLKADYVKKGSFYCHVGGYEDEYAVAYKADKIICDNWEALKHRGSPTIARMYEKKLLNDCDIYADLADIIDGSLQGRDNDQEIIYFNSIGLGFVDVAVAYYFYEKVTEKGLGRKWDMIAKSPIEYIKYSKPFF